MRCITVLVYYIFKQQSLSIIITLIETVIKCTLNSRLCVNEIVPSTGRGAECENRPPFRFVCMMPVRTSKRRLAKQRAAGAAVLGG